MAIDSFVVDKMAVQGILDFFMPSFENLGQAVELQPKKISKSWNDSSFEDVSDFSFGIFYFTCSNDSNKLIRLIRWW